MIRKAFVFAALLLVPAFAKADTGNIARDAGPFEFTLNGSGSNNHNFSGGGGSIGGNVGYVSGPNTHTPEAAPEGGIKFFLTNQAFLYGMIEYNFFWHTSGNDVSSNASHGQFLYGVGLGLRF